MPVADKRVGDIAVPTRLGTVGGFDFGQLDIA
jgi:hypothetical protein